MNGPIELFVRLSHRIGKDALLVQGAGGNTSYKEGDQMWIKASGKWLSHADEEEIFVTVNHHKIRERVAADHEQPLEGAVIGESVMRPSIETTLHALMKQKVVLHTHPVDLLAWAVREDAEQRLTEILEGINWAWVPYARPGLDLTRAVRSVVEGREVDVLVLGNHGLVVGGDNCDHASALMERVLVRCRAGSKPFSCHDHTGLERVAERFGMRLPRQPMVHALAMDNAAFSRCAEGNGMLYPDQAVFLGASMECFSGEDDLQRIAMVMKDRQSAFAVIERQGVLVAMDAKVDVDEMLHCHAEVLMRTDSNAQLRYLTDGEVGDLLDWEPEKYRRSLGESSTA